MDPDHQDVADRHLLTRHVRHHGDAVGASLSELTTRLIPSHSVVGESMPLVVTGPAPWRSQ